MPIMRPDRRTFLRYASRAAGGALVLAVVIAVVISAFRLSGRAAPPFFEMRSGRTGITWVHENAMSPERYLPETWAPGCAFLDYDNDGWMDIYLVNSGPADFYKPKKPLRNALYKNNRDGTFTDVTEKAGVAGGNSFGMGVAVGDYDNDGCPDIFVTAYGRCILYHNNGDGTFTDVTEKAGVDSARLDDQRRLVRLRQRRHGSICSSAASSSSRSTSNVFCGDNKLGKRLLLHPARLQADAEPALPQQRRRHVHRGQRRHRHRSARSARRWAWSRPTSTTTA